MSTTITAPSITLTPAAGLFVDARPFELEHGTRDHGAVLAGLELRHELVGPAGAPLIVVQGGISADAHVAASAADPTPGWWETQAGPGRALDTRRFRILSLDFLGKREAVPVSSGDQARATLLLLDALGVGRVHAFVGASYGGMVALRFAELFPERIERLVAISAPDRPHPFATAWRGVQRELLALGERNGCARDAVVLARALAMLSYRSPEEFEQRFAVPSGSSIEAEPALAYLLARGRDFADRFDAGAFSRLSRAIDLHRADVTRIVARTTLIGADPDWLVPADRLAALAPRFGRPARFVQLRSRFGHDAFLKESATLAPLLAAALEEST